MDIDHMPAVEVAGVEAAALERLPLPGNYRVYSDVRIFEDRSETPGSGREQHGLAPRKRLRPALRGLAHLLIDSS
jgi:hypothetical protein